MIQGLAIAGGWVDMVGQAAEKALEIWLGAPMTMYHQDVHITLAQQAGTAGWPVVKVYVLYNNCQTVVWRVEVLFVLHCCRSPVWGLHLFHRLLHSWITNLIANFGIIGLPESWTTLWVLWSETDHALSSDTEGFDNLTWRNVNVRFFRC